MRGARAAIPCLLAALTLPGCMYAAVAVAHPQNDLDAMAYSQSMTPTPIPVADAATPRPAVHDAAYKLPVRAEVPLGTALGLGDTVLVGERWF